jgi:hypothetical protein
MSLTFRNISIFLPDGSEYGSPGHHAAYTLIPVPNNASAIDWDVGAN